MISWTCFEWKTVGVPTVAGVVTPLVIRAAKPEDREVVKRVLAMSFSMDSFWNDVTRIVAERFNKACDEAFENEEPPCVVLTHGSRIVGASLLDLAPESASHLVSGPCILHEYRNRGFGCVLLQASLVFLREHGLQAARGITRANSVAARFVYRKFGSVSVELHEDPIAA